MKESLTEFKRFHRPDEWEEIRSLMDAHVRGETPFYIHENRLLTKKGEWKWILNRGQVVAWDEEGLVWIDGETYLNRRVHFETLQHVDCVYAWGKQHADVSQHRDGRGAAVDDRPGTLQQRGEHRHGQQGGGGLHHLHAAGRTGTGPGGS